MWTAERVKELRHALGETQQEFARRFRLSVKPIRNWEQGLCPPSGPATVLLDQLARRAARAPAAT